MKSAACACGKLTVEVPDSPLLHTQCSCLDCQRRTGSTCSYMLWYKAKEVVVRGDYREFQRKTVSGNKSLFLFCPACGCHVAVQFGLGAFIFGEDIVEVPLGAFADPSMPAPDTAVWTKFMHDWFENTVPTDFSYSEQLGSLEEIQAQLRLLGKL